MSRDGATRAVAYLEHKKHQNNFFFERTCFMILCIRHHLKTEWSLCSDVIKRSACVEGSVKVPALIDFCFQFKFSRDKKHIL